MQKELFEDSSISPKDSSALLPDLIAPWLMYESSFLSKQEAVAAFETLKSELPWQQPEVVVFGRSHRIPRLQCWQSDPDVIYQYSGKVLEPQPWHPLLLDIKVRLELSSGYKFNSVLVNFYRDGNDKMGWHSDDESELGPNPVVASISLGETRAMFFKNKKSQQTTSIDLLAGSMLVMKAGMQRVFQHQIPARRKVRHGRISLTFRYIVN